MGYIVRMPQLGMSMEQGTVNEWVVDVDESVAEGEPLAIVESEKTTAEVAAHESGRLERQLVSPGETVEPGTPIGIVLGPDEAVDVYLEEIQSKSSGQRENEDGDSSVEEHSAAAPAVDAADVRATPGARKAADVHGVDLRTVSGTGPQGVLTEDDVRDAADEGEADGDVETTWTVVESAPLSTTQRTISDRLSRSDRKTVPVTLHRTVETATISAVQEAAADAGTSASVEDLVVVAVGEALSAHPRFNAVYEDGEHTQIEEVNVGVAVDADGRLMTPVIADVPSRTVESIRAERRRLTDRVVSRTVSPEELDKGTFTVSNLGVHGVDGFTPVINPPQIAILGVGRIRSDETMTLSLTFDHRVVNGTAAAEFLATVSETLDSRATLVQRFENELRSTVSADADHEPRTVRSTTEGDYAGAYRAGEHEVRFDEPESVGGTGSGPSPVDHLLGALCSCISLSIREMARRDEVSIGRIDVEGTASPEHGPITDVSLSIGLETDAQASDLERVITKAERACYVARSLSDELDVRVDWYQIE